MARLEYAARILAFVVDAGESWWAFGVFATFRLGFFAALYKRISDVSRRTSAQRHVVLNPALGSWRARIVVNARIYTLRVDALPVGGTVAVGSAAHDHTSILRISAVAAQAATFGAVSVRIALGVDAAWVSNQARIYAVAVDASFARVAFGIGSAAHFTAYNVRITLVAFFARTDRSMVLHEAGAVGTAAARVAA